MEIESLIFLGFFEAAFLWVLYKIRWWLPIIPFILLYALPPLVLTYANMPVDEKIIAIMNWFVPNTVGGIGGALFEAVAKVFTKKNRED